MSTTFIIILAFVVLFIAYIAYSYNKMKKAENVPDSKKIVTLNSKNFKPVIKKGLVLVDFWASWCAPCKIMAPVLNDIAESENDKLTVSKLNIEHNQALANKFKVRSIPTIIVFKDGIEMKRIVGVKNKKSILNELSALS